MIILIHYRIWIRYVFVDLLKNVPLVLAVVINVHTSLEFMENTVKLFGPTGKNTANNQKPWKEKKNLLEGSCGKPISVHVAD